MGPFSGETCVADRVDAGRCRRYQDMAVGSMSSFVDDGLTPKSSGTNSGHEHRGQHALAADKRIWQCHNISP